MKKLILAISLLSFTFASAYITREEWEDAKRTGQVTPELKAKLDAFFAERPEVLAAFAAEKHSIPGINYLTTPNTHYPDTFDPEKHLWVDRTQFPAGDLTVEQRREQFRAQRKTINDALAVVGLVNKSHSSNITIQPIQDAQHDVHVKGTLTNWTTYPQVASVHFNSVNFAKYVQEQGYRYVQAPKTALYQLPGQPAELDDRNWAVVVETTKNVLTHDKVVEAMRQEPPAPCFAELSRLFSDKNPFWKDTVHYEVADGEIKVKHMHLLFAYNDAQELTVTPINMETPSIAGEMVDEKRSADYSASSLPLYSKGFSNWLKFAEDVKKTA